MTRQADPQAVRRRTEFADDRVPRGVRVTGESYIWLNSFDRDRARQAAGDYLRGRGHDWTAADGGRS